MRRTVYLPDELADQVREVDDLNLSGLVQTTLRRELERRQKVAELSESMGRVTLWLGDEGRRVAFTGRELYDSPQATVYLTRRKQLAVYDGRKLQVFDDFQELAQVEQDQELLATVAAELGEDWTEELDI